jgi:L-asparaginase/N4-(beta-N-acetylglucosaminyl)-L-asparaginase
MKEDEFLPDLPAFDVTNVEDLVAAVAPSLMPKRRVDNEVGGATATGWGEAVIRAVGCFLVVEFMRQGHSPAAACEMAVDRVIEKNPDWHDIQVGFLALDKNSAHGGFCIAPGFTYALYSPDVPNEIFDAPSRI